MQKIIGFMFFIIMLFTCFAWVFIPMAKSEEKIVLKDKYQRTQFTIIKKNGKTTVKDRNGFTVRKLTISKTKASSYLRFNNKRVK